MEETPILQKPLPIPESILWRILYALAVTVPPIICFALVRNQGSGWQSGKLSDYIEIFLSPESHWIFFPLIGFSVLCFILILFFPRKFSEIFIVRLGVYSGALLALQYLLLTVLAVGSGSLILLVVWLAQIVALIIFSALKIVINPKTLIISFISLLIGLYLLYTIQFFDSTSINSNYQIPSAILTSLNFIWMGLLFFWLCFLLSSPLWTLLISWTTAFKLLKHYESKLTLQRGLSIALWLSGFAAAWRVVVLSTLEVYSRLPTTPPECYIATAAAYGHPRFVGSREIIFTNGKSMRVNAQLQNLKCAELVLKSTSPRLHGILRKVYDVVGRKLAVKITNPFLSDIAYLLLKPFEWFAVFIFEIFLSEAKIIAKEFYTR